MSTETQQSSTTPTGTAQVTDSNGEKGTQAKQGASNETQTDAQVVDPKGENEIKDPTSKKFIVLKNKSKALLEEKQAHKAQVEAERAELAKEKEAIEAFKSNKKNPIEALKALGWTYDDVVKFVLEDKVPDELEEKFSKDEIEEKFKTIEDKLTAKEQAEEKAKLEAEQAKLTAQEKQWVSQLDKGIEQAIKADPDKFELLNEQENKGQLIFDLMKAVAQSGEEISPEEAMEEVEAFLTKDYEKKLEEAEKLRTKKRFQKQINTDETKNSPKSKTAGTPVKPASKTLTPSSTPASSVTNKPMTRAERRAEAVKILQGKL